MKSLLLACCAILILTGCSSALTSASSDEISQISTVTITASQTSTPNPSTTPTPEPTPSLTEIPTPSATITEAWITPAPLSEIKGAVLPGRIYGWTPPFYGYIDPNQPISQTLKSLPFPKGVPDPGLALALAFSAYNNQVAYLHLTPDDKLALWIADADLKYPSQVWVDDLGQAGYTSPDDQMVVKWLVSDHYVLIENHPAPNPSGVPIGLVYSTSSKAVVRLSGICKQILFSPRTENLAVACPIETVGFIILEQDGVSWQTSALPDQAFEAQNYVFSPDGQKVLYADNENAVYIINTASKKSIQLPVVYPRFWYKEKALQWSQDGSKVLVLGKDYPEDPPHCVFDSDNGRVHPCWQLIDPVTGARLWWLGQVAYLDATLSFDGKWFVINSIDTKIYPLGRGRSLMVYDASKLNERKVVWRWTLDAIHWGP